MPRRQQFLKVRLVISLALTIPVAVLAMTPSLAMIPTWQWVSAALSTPVVTWGAWPFHLAAWKSARHLTSTMDTLVSLGVSASYLWSLSLLLINPGSSHLYFETAAMITTFLLAGRTAESHARRRAGDAVRALATLGAKKARLLNPDGSETEIPTDMVTVGQILVVRPGEAIPTDGIVDHGRAAIDTALLTGESVPVNVKRGDAVTGATINTNGHLRVRATRVGADTTLARITELVHRAQAGKAPIQRLADRVSSVFVPTVLTIAATTLIGWLASGAPAYQAFNAAVAVMVIACPCALGLATPTALLVGSGRAAQLGIIIKGPQVLEMTRAIDTVLMDKTGTLSDATMNVTYHHGSDPQFMEYASAVESGSAHPVAGAIRRAAPTELSASEFRDHAGRGVSARLGQRRIYVGSPKWMAQIGATLDHYRDSISEGEAQGASICVVATSETTELTINDQPAEQVADADAPTQTNVTSRSHVELAISGMTCAACVRRVEKRLEKLPGVHAEVNLALETATVTSSIDTSTAALIAAVEQAGYSAHLLKQQVIAEAAPPASTSSTPSSTDPDAAQTEGATSELEVIGVMWIRDQVKSDAREAISQLRKLNIEPVILTGDNQLAARHVAQQVGITEVHAGALPDDKYRIVREYQDRGHTVAMVGDGVNDAAALAQAGNQGLGITMGSGADAAIEAGDITLVATRVNAVPTAIALSRRTLRIIKQNLFWAFAYNVAAIPLAIAGVLNPMIAGAAMASSSVMVVANSLRLRQWEPPASSD